MVSKSTAFMEQSYIRVVLGATAGADRVYRGRVVGKPYLTGLGRFARDPGTTGGLSFEYGTRMASCFRLARSARSIGTVHGTQVDLVHGGTYSPTQERTCRLVSSKMYSAVNARVGNVVGNLIKRGVLQDDVGHGGV
jgi:hypothetical protein